MDNLVINKCVLHIVACTLKSEFQTIPDGFKFEQGIRNHITILNDYPF